MSKYAIVFKVTYANLAACKPSTRKLLGKVIGMVMREGGKRPTPPEGGSKGG